MEPRVSINRTGTRANAPVVGQEHTVKEVGLKAFQRIIIISNIFVNDLRLAVSNTENN
jgi:hypothetical protein